MKFNLKKAFKAKKLKVNQHKTCNINNYNYNNNNNRQYKTQIHTRKIQNTKEKTKKFFKKTKKIRKIKSAKLYQTKKKQCLITKLPTDATKSNRTK